MSKLEELQNAAIPPPLEVRQPHKIKACKSKTPVTKRLFWIWILSLAIWIAAEIGGSIYLFSIMRGRVASRYMAEFARNWADAGMEPYSTVFGVQYLLMGICFVLFIIVPITLIYERLIK